MLESKSLNADLKSAFVRLIAKHTGLEMRERDQADLSQKIFLRMQALKIFFPENYYQLLNSHSQKSYVEWQHLISLITNIDSYFFRDQEQFRLIREHLLPEIIQRKQRKKIIQILSAGCSSGEEPYSLAILLKELIPNLRMWNVMILGIDINREALQKAQEGIYTAWSLRGVDSTIKQRYFRWINNQYHLDWQIKQMVQFQYINLIKDSFNQQKTFIQDIDLILCRNVFIYFEKSAVTKALDKFYHILQPFGYLLTGHTELFDQDLNKFQVKAFPESIVYIKKD